MIQKSNDSIYQSILLRLVSIPPNYLEDVDIFLRNITAEIRQKEQNRLKILDLAGSWSDMSDRDFGDYLQVVRDTKSDMFTRNIEL